MRGVGHEHGRRRNHFSLTMHWKNLITASVLVACLSPLSAASDATAEAALSADASGFLDAYCLDCHQGEGAEAELDLARLQSLGSIASELSEWDKIRRRVGNGDMPPDGSDIPTMSQRDRFVQWVDQTLRQAACADGIAPGPAPLRRLNRSEYAATIRDLLNIHIDAGQALPTDGAGGEGFDNAAETLFISPIHAEKYLDAARTALGHAFKDPRSRQRWLTVEPGDEVTNEQAARRVLADFLPRAFRRPVDEIEIDNHLTLFRACYQRDPSFDDALQRALEAVLISPHFLFRVESPNPDPRPRLVENHEMGVRLSYFLWGTMPDDQLLRFAREGKLNDPLALENQVKRMLGSNRSAGGRGEERVRQFAHNFVGQWLGTRALGRQFKPDRSVAPDFDSELLGGMRYEPVLFFQEIIAKNRSLLELIDADFTYLNRRLARHYQIKAETSAQPRRVELPADSHRGGLLGMAAVLAVSSYPHRTSPVLRGKWVLETLLGDPPPPPPPNVPELDETEDANNVRTLRERLEQHRQNPTCATCHDRIDPLGFGLENYDVLGRWRTEDAGQPIDSRGELPDGTQFEGPEPLKQVLLARKDQFARNLTAKMLGYALGRGLTNEDYCTVEQIVKQLTENEYLSHTLILGIVHSVPFRYKPGTDPEASVKTEPDTPLETSR